LKENPTEKERGDLMMILLQDELFKDDIEMIIDECLTFFLAGTLTTFNSVTTTMTQAIKQPVIAHRMQEEVKNFLKSQHHDSLKECLDLNTLCELQYIS